MSDMLNDPIAKMAATGQAQLAIDTFSRHLHAVRNGATGFLTKDHIKPVKNIPSIETLDLHSENIRDKIKKTIVLKLNGGLGTSMGLNGAKSLLPAKGKWSFLDVIVQQVLYIRKRFRVPLPLVLMNSFRTKEESLNALKKHKELGGSLPFDFLQHQVPKIRQDNYLSVQYPQDPSHEWCPPGHGDIYTSIVTSGILKQMLDQGYEYAFVSNSDNLGATLDLKILDWFAEEECPFLMEVADRNINDKKGGHLAGLKVGGLALRELAQCPADELDTFQNTRIFQYFNTNSLWINLKQLSSTLAERDFVLDLPLIVNQKTVNPNDRKSTPIYQLETAMGSAISLFSKAAAIRVSRDRFMPVKTTNDLVRLWSDLFELQEDFSITPAPDRKVPELEIDLDPNYFGQIHQLKARFPNGVPSLKYCEQLVVKNDVTFDSKYHLTGCINL